MYGEVIDPFGKWADMPEIPEPKQEPKEDDRAAHVMGCLAVVGALTLFFITIIIFMLV